MRGFQRFLYFRTNDSSRPDYEKAGMKPFQPSAKQTLRNYMEVPVDVIERPGELEQWALRALATIPPARPGGRARKR